MAQTSIILIVKQGSSLHIPPWNDTELQFKSSFQQKLMVHDIADEDIGSKDSDRRVLQKHLPTPYFQGVEKGSQMGKVLGLLMLINLYGCVHISCLLEG